MRNEYMKINNEVFTVEKHLLEVVTSEKKTSFSQELANKKKWSYGTSGNVSSLKMCYFSMKLHTRLLLLSFSDQQKAAPILHILYCMW